MRKACTVVCAGIFCAAVSTHALAVPPEGRGKPTSIPSHFIHFPTPQNAVGVFDAPRPGFSGSPNPAAQGLRGNGPSPSEFKSPGPAAMPAERDSTRDGPIPECIRR